MTTLVSFPGRNGDLLWAMPSIRAISQALGEPVGLQIAGEFQAIGPLLSAQPYIKYVWADSRWPLVPPEEWRAPTADGTTLAAKDPIERKLEIGYRGWPTEPLAQYVYAIAQRECAAFGLELPPLDLETPWITIDGPGAPTEIAAGFNEEWFELKYGLLALLEGQLSAPILQLAPEGSRWLTEHPAGGVPVLGCDWREAARAIRNSDLFIGCCSGLHVLAAALGKPVILVEPNVSRRNPIFYPLGTEGRVRAVRGTDGEFTFDSRAVAQAVRDALRQ